MKRIINYIFIFSVLSTTGFFSSSCSDMEKETEFEIYTYPEITVSDFNPKSARPTVEVTITGTNFGEYKEAAKVYFNGVISTRIVSYSDTEMIVEVPENVGSGPLVVNVWTHTVELGDFDYIPGATLTSISPTYGKAGDTISIRGKEFGNDSSVVSVLIGNAKAELVSVSDEEINAIVPDATSGVVYVIVESQKVEGSFFLIGEEILSGTIIGHEGSYGNNPETTIEAAFDGDVSTFIDGPTATGYVGYDLGTDINAELTRVRYMPRGDKYPERMLKGEFRGSNDSTLTDYDILYTIEETPTEGVFTEVSIDSSGNYRYIYYYTTKGFCNVSELEFYGIVSQAE